MSNRDEAIARLKRVIADCRVTNCTYCVDRRRELAVLESTVIPRQHRAKSSGALRR